MYSGLMGNPVGGRVGHTPNTRQALMRQRANRIGPTAVVTESLKRGTNPFEGKVGEVLFRRTIGNRGQLRQGIPLGALRGKVAARKLVGAGISLNRLILEGKFTPADLFRGGIKPEIIVSTYAQIDVATRRKLLGQKAMENLYTDLLRSGASRADLSRAFTKVDVSATYRGTTNEMADHRNQFVRNGYISTADAAGRLFDRAKAAQQLQKTRPLASEDPNGALALHSLGLLRKHVPIFYDALMTINNEKGSADIVHRAMIGKLTPKEQAAFETLKRFPFDKLDSIDTGYINTGTHEKISLLRALGDNGLFGFGTQHGTRPVEVMIRDDQRRGQSSLYARGGVEDMLKVFSKMRLPAAERRKMVLSLLRENKLTVNGLFDGLINGYAAEPEKYFKRVFPALQSVFGARTCFEAIKRVSIDRSLTSGITIDVPFERQLGSERLDGHLYAFNERKATLLGLLDWKQLTASPIKAEFLEEMRNYNKHVPFSTGLARLLLADAALRPMSLPRNMAVSQAVAHDRLRMILVQDRKLAPGKIKEMAPAIGTVANAVLEDMGIQRGSKLSAAENRSIHNLRKVLNGRFGSAIVQSQLPVSVARAA